MNGSWRTYRRGARWDRPRRSAWAVLRGPAQTAVQWGGPTLRVLRPEQVRRDPLLSRLGPDILDPGLESDVALVSLRRASPDRALGEALLDQSLLSGIGNIWKSEGCFAAGVDPWRPLGSLEDGELRRTVAATRDLMGQAVEGRRVRAIYRRAGEPCPACGGRIRSRGQGDENRTTYWCGRCQS